MDIRVITMVIVFVLALIAGIVACRQSKYGNRDNAVTWALIVLYWVVLLIKNFVEGVGML